MKLQRALPNAFMGKTCAAERRGLAAMAGTDGEGGGKDGGAHLGLGGEHEEVGEDVDDGEAKQSSSVVHDGAPGTS